MGAGGPAPGRRHPDQARDHHGGDPRDQIVPGRMEELPQDRRHRRTQHDRANHGQVSRRMAGQVPVLRVCRLAGRNRAIKPSGAATIPASSIA